MPAPCLTRPPPRADWARHRPQCRRLQQRQAPGQGQGGAERQTGTAGVPAGGGGPGD